MRDIGVDLHKRNFQCCYLTEGKSEFRKYSLSELEVFKSSLQSKDRVALESTGNSRWFQSQIKDLAGAVVVVNPKQFKVISESSRKTDKSDAELLAFYLSKGLLPEVRMKDELSS